MIWWVAYIGLLQGLGYDISGRKKTRKMPGALG